MKTKYILYTFLSCILAISFCLKTSAQNKPDLSTTSPQGSLTNTILYKSIDYTDPGVGNRKHNYQRVWIPQKPVANSAQINEQTAPNENLQSTTYTDGFGNHLETITRFGVSQNYHSVQISDVKLVDGLTYKYLPYSVSSLYGESFRYNSFTEQEQFYSTLFPNEGNTAYGLERVEYVGNNSVRHVKVYTSGKSQIGQGRCIDKSLEVSSNSTIQKWELNANNFPITTPTSTYNSGELVEETTIGSHNRKVTKFSDLEGRTIALFKLVDFATNKYEKTYFVYDELGRNAYTLTPKAVEKIENNGWVATQLILDNLCNYSHFDDMGRIYESNVPSTNGKQEIVYDNNNRPCLTRTPVQADNNEWSFVVYDVLGRVAFNGILHSTNNRSYWQYLLDGTGTAPTNIPNSTTLNSSTEIYTYLNNGINLIQDGGNYPSTINNCDIYSYNYYDHYAYSDLASLPYNSTFDTYFYPDTYSNANSVPSTPSVFPINGMLTGTKTRILKPTGTSSKLDDWKFQVFYYDNDGRIVQVSEEVSDKVSTQTNSKYFTTITNLYDWKGRMLRTVSAHTKSSTTSGITVVDFDNIVTTKFEYEPKTFKLTKVSQKINSQDWMTLSINSYDLKTGALKIKNIGGIELQNYTYNMKGQLTGINPAYAETGITTSTNCTFGESIKYDYGFTDKRYDGNISGIIWKTPSVNSRAYGYTYDEAGRMINAEFSQLDGVSNTTTADWKKLNTDLSEQNISYDLNGNIIGLTRRGTGTSGLPVDADILSYVYEDNDVSNRLKKVDDASSYTPTNGIVQDFQDNSTGVDYAYDKNGNMSSDGNKKITSITYNCFNKPMKIIFSNGNTIENVYSASGEKISDFKNIGGVVTKRLFIGDYVYTDNTPESMNQPEGRTRIVPGSGGPNTSQFIYDFYVKDHLGNVRNTLTAEEIPFNEYFADHEIAYANIENLVFQNVEEVRDDNPNGDLSNPKVATLDGNDPAKRIGTALLLHVMAGDKFNAHVEAEYFAENTGPSGSAPIGAMIASLVSTFTENQIGVNQEEFGHTIETVNGTFTSANISTYNALKDIVTDSAKPKAYLNYLVFDEEFKLVSSQSGAIQVDAVGAWHTIGTADDITLEQGGYLAIYISNESFSKKVYFDKLDIKFYKGKLLEENHYYPFGMCLRISQDASITPENTKLYQTKDFITTEDMNIYDFDARQYDPLTGRFTSIDPAGQFASGYVGMGNNPVSLTDPSGMYALGGFDNYYAMVGINREKAMENNMRKFGLNNNYFELEQAMANLETAMTYMEEIFRRDDFILLEHERVLRTVHINIGLIEKLSKIGASKQQIEDMLSLPEFDKDRLLDKLEDLVKAKKGIEMLSMKEGVVTESDEHARANLKAYMEDHKKNGEDLLSFLKRIVEEGFCASRNEQTCAFLENDDYGLSDDGYLIKISLHVYSYGTTMFSDDNTEPSTFYPPGTILGSSFDFCSSVVHERGHVWFGVLFGSDYVAAHSNEDNDDNERWARETEKRYLQSLGDYGTQISVMNDNYNLKKFLKSYPYYPLSFNYYKIFRYGFRH